MGVGKIYVSPIKGRRGGRKTEQERMREREKEREKSFPAALILQGKKSPNNLAPVNLEKMRAAKNAYNTS